MAKRIQAQSILIMLIFLLSALWPSFALASSVGTENVSTEPEKLIFCTFEEGTADVSYTPQTLD